MRRGLRNLGNLPHAQHLGERDPPARSEQLRPRQKQVEYAFKSGDKAKLVDAYLELADILLRRTAGQGRAVYQRVAEHDTTNERPKAATAMLAPAAAPPPEPPPAPARSDGAKERSCRFATAARKATFVDLRPP